MARSIFINTRSIIPNNIVLPYPFTKIIQIGFYIWYIYNIMVLKPAFLNLSVKKRQMTFLINH
jgi:hypothetical protein